MTTLAIILRDLYQRNDGIAETGITHGLFYYPFHGSGRDKMELLVENGPDIGLLKVSPLIPKTIVKDDQEVITKLVDGILSLGVFDEIYLEPSIDFPESLGAEKRLIETFLEKKPSLRFGVLASHYCWLGKCQELLAAAPNSFSVPIIDDEKMKLEEIFTLFKTELDNPKPLIVSLSTKSKIDLPYLLEEFREYIPETIFWSLYSLRDLNLPALKDVTKKPIAVDERKNVYVARHSVGIREGPSLAAMLIGNTKVSSHYQLCDIQPVVDGIVWAKIKEGGYVTLSQNNTDLFEKNGDS
jgi:hypothetical protein